MRTARGRMLPRSAMLALLPLLIAADKPRDFVVQGDGVVPARVGGQPARVRISPWAPAAPTLNPGFARAIGLHRGLIGFAVKVGPTKVSGDTSVTRLSYSGLDYRRRVVWFERDYTSGADVELGPGGVPADIVRFVWRAPRAGDRTATLALVEQSFRPSYARVRAGDRDITLLFDPRHPRTLATAGAGVALASAFRGTLSGAPGRAQIAFGIERPVRTMRFAQPFMIGPITVRELLIRVADGGTVAGVPDADADPEEIVVQAKGGPARRDVVIVGRDLLGDCAGIVFDKRARQIRLSC